MMIYNAERNDAAMPGVTVYRLYNLQRTTTLPTVEGWYWLDNVGFVHVVLEEYPRGNELVVYTAESGRGNEEPEPPSYYGKLGYNWLGPFPIAEPPKEGKG